LRQGNKYIFKAKFHIRKTREINVSKIDFSRFLTNSDYTNGEQKGVKLVNFRSIEQIMTEQPSIERKIKCRGKNFKLIKTAHDVSHGGYTDLTRYTYHSDEEQQSLLFFCYKGKIVLVETESDST
jgi:hypothetical protein